MRTKLHFSYIQVFIVTIKFRKIFFSVDFRGTKILGVLKIMIYINFVEKVSLNRIKKHLSAKTLYELGSTKGLEGELKLILIDK